VLLTFAFSRYYTTPQYLTETVDDIVPEATLAITIGDSRELERVPIEGR